MKKISSILLITIFAFILSACSEKKETIPNPASDPGGYVSGMVDLNKKAQNDIQSSVDKENKKINDALNENSMNTQKNPNIPTDLAKKYSAALIKTNFGEIKVKLYSADAPMTVNNFLKLAQDKFYDDTKFHRVIKDFMIQGGDPLSKNNSQKTLWGTGDPGYKFEDEINSKKLIKGSLAMANSGPNTNGSQFFIVTAPSTPWLDGKHTNFGEVISGMDVVLKIETLEISQASRPLKDAIIESITALEK